MNKAAHMAVITLLPILAYAPLSVASLDHRSKASGVLKLDKPLDVNTQNTKTLKDIQRKV